LASCYLQQLLVSVFAQGTLKGRITDKATGEGVVEATVVVEGTNYGVLTDLDGYYSLELADGEFMIQVTYVGYAAQTQVSLSKTDKR
jgi:hypothetical protein